MIRRKSVEKEYDEGYSIIAVATAFGATGCAPAPEDVVATYVSPATYSSYGCRQIVSERNAVVAKVNELNGVQAQKAEDDGAKTAVGLVLFWPALLFLGHDDVAPQLASAKGNYDALTTAGTSKGCF